MKKIIKLVGNVGGVDNSYNRILDGVWLEGELSGLTSEDEVEFIIHSYGGTVFEGQYMYNILFKCPALKVAHVYGSCMSMATIVSMACDKVYMCKNSLYMVHKASVGAGGNSNDIESTLDLLNAVDSIAIDTYSEKTGLSKSKLLKEFMTGFDKWLTPKEALKHGFIDAIKDPVKEVIVSDNYSSYELGFSSLFDSAEVAEMKQRPFILNKFITKTDTVMKDEKTATGVVDESPKSEAKGTDKELILSLNAEANSLRGVIANRDTEILNITKEKDLLEAKVDELQLEANEKIVKAEAEKEKAVALLAKKDLELKVQEVSNAINLAVAKMKNADGTQINAEKEKSIITQFSQRHAITISDGVETVVDKVSGNVVADNIHSAVVAYAITAGLVQSPKKGIGTANNITNPNTYGSDFEKAQENSVLAEISKADKELQKEGHPKFSETWCRVMNSKFPNNDRAVHPVDKAKYNLK